MIYESLCYADCNIASISENSYIVTQLSCLELDVTLSAWCKSLTSLLRG